MNSYSVYIDISIHLPETAYGRLSGSIRVPIIPVRGDLVIFDFFGKEVILSNDTYFSFSGEVQGRVIGANRDSGAVTLILERIFALNASDAEVVTSAFEAYYGFEIDIY